jgi:putative PIN family toxin of toxin-antitoxin system
MASGGRLRWRGRRPRCPGAGDIGHGWRPGDHSTIADVAGPARFASRGGGQGVAVGRARDHGGRFRSDRAEGGQGSGPSTPWRGGSDDCICAIIWGVKVVVDTNVFVASLLGPSGASRSILRGCLEGRLVPLMGAALFAEYESLLGREALFRECRLDSGQREAVLNAFLSVCRWTVIYFSWRPNLPDEADNHLIELAVAGGAGAVVTKNARHFMSAELHFPGLRILKPEQLLKEMVTWRP